MRKLWHRLFGHGRKFRATGDSTITNRMTGASTVVFLQLTAAQQKKLNDSYVWVDVDMTYYV